MTITRRYKERNEGYFKYTSKLYDERTLEAHIKYLDRPEFEDWRHYDAIEVIDTDTYLILWRRTFYKLTD